MTGPDARPPAVQEMDWACYTPEGFYDASRRDQAVQFRRHDEPLPLEQFENTHYASAWAEELLGGEPPRWPGSSTSRPHLDRAPRAR